MDKRSLLLENPLLKVLLLEDERNDWVNPIFDEREKCGEFHALFPMLLEQASNFFEYYTKEEFHLPLLEVSHVVGREGT